MKEPAMNPRQLWHMIEPIHAVVYYAPEMFAESAAFGYTVDERWPSYFPLRAAPMGAVGPEAVTSAFYSFSPAMVARHVPAAWRIATPAALLAARLTGTDAGLRALLGSDVDSPALAEAAELGRQAALAANTAGRPLAAANAALPWPQEPHMVLWHAATILREHRGDGHIAALLATGLDPIESLVSFAAIGAAPREVFHSRGWTNQEWDAAAERLCGRGLLTDDGKATTAGVALRDEVERITDELAAAPWSVLGSDADRFIQLIAPFTITVATSGLLPTRSTLGIIRD
jgi:hypothetical protein